MKTHVKLAKISKKTAAFIAAATTLFAGLSISSAAPQQASAATRRSKRHGRSMVCRKT
jgi:alpha-amylase